MGIIIFARYAVWYPGVSAPAFVNEVSVDG